MRTYRGRASDPLDNAIGMSGERHEDQSRSFDSDARQAATLAIDALSKWRNELTITNERWLAKVLDQMSAVARALGWPDSVLDGMREHLLSASKLQAAGHRSIHRHLVGASEVDHRPEGRSAKSLSCTRRCPARVRRAVWDERHVACANGVLDAGGRDDLQRESRTLIGCCDVALRKPHLRPRHLS